MNKNETFIDFVIDSWKFSNTVDKVIEKLDEADKKRYKGRLAWYQKKIETTLSESGYKLVDMSNSTYDIGMALTPLNLDEFTNDDELVVDYIIDPIIINNDGKIIKTGTAILRRKEL